MSERAEAGSAVPWQDALQILRAITAQDVAAGGDGVDEELLEMIGAVDFDATDAVQGWIADAVPR